MAPVYAAIDRSDGLDPIVCVTGQHRQMLRQVLDVFDIPIKHDLDVMRPSQDLAALSASILTGLTPVLEQEQPARVLVHGDTTTTMAASLAAFYRRIPVGHVEAGLRTGDMTAPWPEEMNRRVCDVIADLHFAPTDKARKNLLGESVPPSGIHVTGNTVIDALFMAREIVREPGRFRQMSERYRFLSPDKRLILVTGHRRESFGPGFQRLCEALKRIADLPSIEILYPVHLNPNVAEPVRRQLSDLPNVHLVDPVDYLDMVYLMGRAHLIVTDSGGIQEEAPSLGKPVLVTREVTERPEAVEAGTVRLVGTDVERLVGATAELLEDEAAYRAMARAHNPYGDGHAAERIAKVLAAAHAS